MGNSLNTVGIDVVKTGTNKLNSVVESIYEMVNQENQEIEENQQNQENHENKSLTVENEFETPKKILNENNKSNLSETSPSPLSTNKFIQKNPNSFQIPTFNSLFEAKLGAVHLSSLENLALDSSIKSQKVYKKLNSDLFDESKKQEKLIEDIYSSNQVENIDLSLLEFPFYKKDDDDDPKLIQNLETLVKKKSIYNSRIEAINIHANKLIQSNLESSIQETINLTQIIVNYCTKLQIEGLRQISEFTSLSIFQILISVQYFKSALITKSISLIEGSQYLVSLSLICKENITNITSEIISSMKIFLNKLKTFKFDESNNVEDSLKKIHFFISSMQTDKEIAVSSLFEAKNLSLTVMKYLSLSKLNIE